MFYVLLTLLFPVIMDVQISLLVIIGENEPNNITYVVLSQRVKCRLKEWST